jgi:Flp pilus assembly protein TadD
MHLQLGKALAKKRQYREAITHFRMAHQWMPGDIEAVTALSRLLATAPEAEGGSAEEGLRFAKEGESMLRRMPRTDPIDRILVLDTRAIASANTGRFPEAVEAARQALGLAQMMTSPADRRQAQDLVADLRGRLKLFESNEAYREPPSR